MSDVDIKNIRLSDESVAEAVLERLNERIKLFKYATVSDFKVLVGLPIRYADSRCGWTNLDDVKVYQDEGDYLIDFPPTEPI